MIENELYYPFSIFIFSLLFLHNDACDVVTQKLISGLLFSLPSFRQSPLSQPQLSLPLRIGLHGHLPS